jgi:hypothetical protein
MCHRQNGNFSEGLDMTSKNDITINDEQRGEAMGIEANKAIVRQYVELYNTGHVELWSNQDTLVWLQQPCRELKFGNSDSVLQLE